MPAPRVPIIATVSKSWIDAFRAIRAMPVVAACALTLHALIAVGVFFTAGAILMNNGRSATQWISSPSWFVFGIFNATVQIVLLAPLLIAVHRYVIRGDVARSYPLHPLRPSFLRYVGTLILIVCAYRATDLISILLPAMLASDAASGIELLSFGLMIAVVVVHMRHIALFPAIAVNAPNASWSAVTPADAGNVFRILVVLACVVLPAAVCGWLLRSFLGTPDWPYLTGGVVLSLAMSLVQLPFMCALGAAMARIYLAIETVAVPAPASTTGNPVAA
jgi:hypothetical protein